jgi:hypothetical protein
MDLTRCKAIDISNSRPAIDGGELMFKEKLKIIRPTLFDPAEMRDEIKEIFSSGSVTVSKYVKLFEQECARYLGVKEAVAVSSATSGLMLAVKALGLTGYGALAYLERLDAGLRRLRGRHI